VTNVVVRNGFSYLQDSKKDLDTIGQIPLEYYECQDDGLKQIAVGPERKKLAGIVWAKFGRYMCQQLGQAERRVSSEASPCQNSTFVRFYERLGAVGIWGFSDGCFQVSQNHKRVGECYEIQWLTLSRSTSQITRKWSSQQTASFATSPVFR
jgi:myosin-1